MVESKEERKLYLKKAYIIHNSIINSLESRLLNSVTDYSLVKKEHNYYNSKWGCPGECDLHALYSNGKNKYLLCFEVKVNHSRRNRRSALKQLSKDVDYYSRILNHTRAFKFYVYGQGNEYFIEWIRYKSLPRFKIIF
jgi:hypothetical protein